MRCFKFKAFQHFYVPVFTANENEIALNEFPQGLDFLMLRNKKENIVTIPHKIGSKLPFLLFRWEKNR